MTISATSMFPWDKRFAQKLDDLHSAEGRHLDFQAGDVNSLVSAFLSHRSSAFDPPMAFRWVTLERFMAQGKLGPSTSSPGSQQHPQERQDPVLVDDRRDTTGSAASTRVWDSETYMQRPPAGENVYPKVFHNLNEFRTHMLQDVSVSSYLIL